MKMLYLMSVGALIGSYVSFLNISPIQSILIIFIMSLFFAFGFIMFGGEKNDT